MGKFRDICMKSSKGKFHAQEQTSALQISWNKPYAGYLPRGGGGLPYETDRDAGCLA